MSTSEIFVLTGASTGMGLRLAEKLLARSGADVIAGVRSPDRAAALKRLDAHGRLTILPLDLSEMASVRAFAGGVIRRLGPEARISAIFCNAGLQIIGPKRMTADGVEETFAVNHLGHFLLVETLLDHMTAGGTVISTASATHHPDNRLAALFGFRGAVFRDAASVAAGDMSVDMGGDMGGDGNVGRKRSTVQQGMDRYATSKLCNILFTSGMADRIPPDRARFLAFDPGLMPGTNLARQRPAPARFVWKRILPALRGIVPGVSAPDRSADALMRAALDPDSGWRSGDYVDFTGNPASRSAEAADTRLAGDLITVSRRILARDQDQGADQGTDQGLGQDGPARPARSGEVHLAHGTRLTK